MATHRSDLDSSAMLPLHPRDFLILMALTDGSQHGYGLVKAIEAESEGEVQMDPANLYRSLRRLERDGLVVEVEGPPDEETERRRYYGLTEYGDSVVRAEALRVSRLVRTAKAKKLIPPAEAAS